MFAIIYVRKLYENLELLKEKHFGFDFDKFKGY